MTPERWIRVKEVFAGALEQEAARRASYVEQACSGDDELRTEVISLLEAHDNFERDFRGDALQPAALDLFGQMGMAERVLSLALTRHAKFPLHAGSDSVAFLDVSGLKTTYPFIAMVPQAPLLEAIVAEARRLPNFTLITGAQYWEQTRKALQG